MRSNETVVVLNKYDQYIGETTVRKAVRKIFSGRAISLSESDKKLSKTVKTPLVIKMKYFDFYKYKSDKVPYSDRQIFNRDKNICQYWHDYKLVPDEDGKWIQLPTKRYMYKCPPSERTIDHVIPISRGGKRASYKNSVCCCRYCNEIIKKDQTPNEAGLTLIKIPEEPKRIKGTVATMMFLYDDLKPSHKAYLKLYPKAEEV
jgi:5-methylcytosine-specific restriction endonuclease McrA